LEHRKTWFDEECAKLDDRRKKAKLQWLQDPSEVNEDNLSDDKINDLGSNSENKKRDLYVGINTFKKGCQHRTKWGERDALLADTHYILNRWKTYCPTVESMHTAEPFVPQPSASEVKIAIRKLKRCKPPGVYQILAELMPAGEATLRSEIHKRIKFTNVDFDVINQRLSGFLYPSDSGEKWEK
jgi:hypothetical protein